MSIVDGGRRGRSSRPGPSTEAGPTPESGGAAASPSSGHEIELKLLVPAGAFQAILAAPLVMRHARRKPIARRLEATYFDTPEGLLAAHAVALRVRKAGRRFVQTLKTPPGADPLRRGEYESPLPGPVLDLSLLPLDQLGPPLSALAADSLLPLFTTQVRRRVVLLDLPDGVVELAVDEGWIEAAGRREPISEVELELKSGDTGALYELALALLDIAPLRIGTASKSERGYALARGTRAKATKARPTLLSADDTADAAILSILSGCQRHLIANLPVAEAGQDVEGVHQTRVALRRLRSALALFRREIPAPAVLALSADSRRLARALGAARNWDVFISSTIPDMAAQQLPDVDFHGVATLAGPLRAAAYDEARTALVDQQTTHFLLALGRTIERRSWRNDIDGSQLAVLTGPARDFGARALSRLHRKALKQGRHLDRLEPEARHELRLTLKKLRYAAEFFLTLFDDGPRASDYLKRLACLQDTLGVANDRATTSGLLQAIAAGSRDPDIHRAIGTIIGWQAHAGTAGASTLEREWRGFRKSAPFWSD
ncbi:CYTH and CHAD domain-containing protein [Ancylobacter terrae]|uniref:CYTH and CHAD domain-containing protein n=1 Tax=Ancylobacter sp. sgz301288 TaxID=3342077 RepID=UPI00385A1E72